MTIGLEGVAASSIGPHERVSHGMAAGRSVKLEEDPVDADGLQVWANGSRG